MHIRSTRPAARPSFAAVLPFLAVGLLFLATRTALLLFTVRERDFVMPSVTNDVKEIYVRWYDVLSGGSFPDHDVMWQYPPAAALVILAPALLPFLSYPVAFYWISFVVDCLTFGVLLRASQRRMAEEAEAVAAGTVAPPSGRWAWVRRQPLAAWVWVLGVALGGPIAYGRYDLIVTGVAVSGLVLLVRAENLRGTERVGARGRRWYAGGLLALGALLKVWPALLFLCAGPGRRWKQTWSAAVVTGSLILLGFWVTMPHALSFLNSQGGRGIEVESIAALPFHVASHHGWDGYVALNYGSMEYIGPHIDLAAKLCLIASALAFGWLVYWRITAKTWHDSTPADAALVAVLLFVVTSRVISPQYMVWMVGLSAVCALNFGPRGTSVMRLPVVLVLIATALSCWEYPYQFDELLNAERGAVLLVTVRNVLLVGAAVIGAARLWRSTRTQAGHEAATGAMRVLVTQGGPAQDGSRSRSQEMSAP